jgi:hypothetical protein
VSLQRPPRPAGVAVSNNRPGVDPEAGFLDHTGAPAGHGFPVDHHDLVIAPGEMARCRQAAETGPATTVRTSGSG